MPEAKTISASDNGLFYYYLLTGILQDVILIYTRGADKSLDRPGRKQATATKLGIFIQHAPHEAQYTS